MPISEFQNDLTSMVREFQVATGRPTVDLQYRLIFEEAGELIEAAFTMHHERTKENAEALLKEMADYLYSVAGLKVLVDDDPVTTEARGKYLLDNSAELAITIGYANNLITLAEKAWLTTDMVLGAFTRIHDSNMTKVSAVGDCAKDEHGKVLKGSNYQPPYLDDLAGDALAAYEHMLETYAEQQAA